MYFFFFSEINCKKVLIVSFVINKRLLFSSLLGYPFTVQHRLFKRLSVHYLSKVVSERVTDFRAQGLNNSLLPIS